MSEQSSGGDASSTPEDQVSATPDRSASVNEDGRPIWNDRVTLESGGNGRPPFAHTTGEVITTGGLDALQFARDNVDPGIGSIELDATFTLLTNVPDVPSIVRELELAGFRAQPNHVFFAHDSCCCGPHPSLFGGVPWLGGFAAPAVGGGPRATAVAGAPAYASPAYASPAYASPAYASPAYASPAYASPAYASPAYASPAYASPAYASPAYLNPVYVDPAYASGRRRSSARPATKLYADLGIARLAAAEAVEPTVEVVVLDTGYAMHDYKDLQVEAVLDLAVSEYPAASDTPTRPPGLTDELEPASGHGTFIAGLIRMGAPCAKVQIRSVLGPLGDGDEVTIGKAIKDLGAPHDPARGGLLNLSFGGSVMDTPGYLAAAVALAQKRGWVVVASAGNDATCEEQFPAAFPEVVAVGAVGPYGPAPFTNYGPWVRACAPGVDLVSTFFKWDGDQPPVDGVDQDKYTGWACWSGTSFSAPLVVAAVAREMALSGATAEQAVTRVIDHPALLRLPGLGTVINAL